MKKITGSLSSLVIAFTLTSCGVQNMNAQESQKSDREICEGFAKATDDYFQSFIDGIDKRPRWLGELETLKDSATGELKNIMEADLLSMSDLSDNPAFSPEKTVSYCSTMFPELG